MKRSILVFMTWVLFFPRPAFPAPPASPGDRSQEEMVYLRRGEDHFFAHRFGAALQWFRKALEINPDNALAHAFTGDILLSMKDPDQALRHYVIASELESDPSPEFFRIGQVYYLKGDGDRSEEYFLRALKRNPELAEAHFYLALLAYRKKKNRVETLHQLKLFREKRPEFPGKTELDRAIALLENPETPTDESKPLLEVDPLRLFFRPGRTAEEKKPEKPAAEIKRAEPSGTETTRDSPPAKTADQPIPSPAAREPVPHFLALKHPPEGPLQKALVYREDDPEKALAVLSAGRAKDPGNGKLASLQCEIYLETKQPGAALSPCKDAARLVPDFRNLQNLGVVYEILHDSANAFEAYSRALDARLDPDLAYRTATMGMSLPAPGKPAEVRRILERLLARSPDHRDGLILLLHLQDGEDNAVGLRATAERLAALYPDDPIVLREIIQAFLSHPDTEKQALPLLKQYCEKTPEDAMAGLALSRLYLKLGMEEEALAFLGDLYRRHQENEDVVREILILFLHNNRNLDSAENIARSFLQNAKDPAAKDRILAILPESMRLKLLPPPAEKQQSVPVAEPPARSEEKTPVDEKKP